MPSSTSSTIPHFAPTLPTELIEQIMQEAKFSKSDLVHCCLVSRQFLNPARKLLYEQLEIRCSEASEEEISVYDLGRPSSLVLASRRTALLLRTLEDSSNLQQLPTSLYFLDVQYTISPPVPSSRTRGQVMEDVLSLTSNVQRVRLGSRFSNSVLRVSTHSKMRNIKMLGTTGVVHCDTSGDLIPTEGPLLPNLEVLDCQQQRNASLLSFSHALRVLQLPCDALRIDFSLIPSLVHLYFTSFASGAGSVQRPDLSTLLHLQTLLINPRSLWRHNGEETCDTLLSDKMPPHKMCLAFPSTVPYDLLSRRLNQSTPILVEEIRLSAAHRGGWFAQKGLETLSESCSKAGVKLSFDLADEIDIFHL